MAPAGFQAQAVRPPEAAGVILACWSGRLAARGGDTRPRGQGEPALFVKMAEEPIVLSAVPSAGGGRLPPPLQRVLRPLSCTKAKWKFS